MQQAAAFRASFQGLPGQQIGQNFSCALPDDRPVIENGELHSFGIAVNGRAAGAVKGVESILVRLEVVSRVRNVSGLERCF